MAVSFKPGEQEPWFRAWKLTFGQYKGTALKDVDAGYLSFLMDGSSRRNPKEAEAIELEWRWRARNR